MAPDNARQEIEREIAVIEENLRDLVEEATAFSGAADEERTSDRTADQERELERLKAHRDGLKD